MRSFFVIAFLLFSSATLKAQTFQADLFNGLDQLEIDAGEEYGKYHDIDIEESSGKRVIIWAEADYTGTTNRNIYYQIFNEDMSPVTVVMTASETTVFDQMTPEILVNQQDGTFVITWASNHHENYDIYIRKFSISDGSPLTSQILVNTEFLEGRQTYPLLAFDYKYNELIVGWLDQDGRDVGSVSANNGSFFKSVPYATFTPILKDYQVNIEVTSHQFTRHIEISPVTNELYTVGHCHGYGSDYDIVFRKFTRNADGTFSGASEIRENANVTGSQENPRIFINSKTGDYAVAWYGNTDSYAKVYDRNGLLIKGEWRLNIPTANHQRFPRIVWDEFTNTFTVFYYYSESNVVNIRYQIYDEEFNSVGTETLAIPSSMNLGNYYTDHNVRYDAKRKKVLLAYRKYPAHNNPNARIYFRQLSFDHPAVRATTIEAQETAIDQTMNWVDVKTFDEEGNVIHASRNYYDEFGRKIQTQIKNIEEDKILGTAILYDQLGRPAISTLPAPIMENTNFSYKGAFVSVEKGGMGVYTNYSWDDFDRQDNANTSVGWGSVSNPRPVASNTGLGWYYSNYNTNEEYVGTTSFPYSRVTYNNDVAGGITKRSRAGEALKMGGNHESKKIILPLLNELEHYRQQRDFYLGAPSASLKWQGYKEVIIDENGIEQIYFYNKHGKLLSTALAGGTSSKTLSATVGVKSFYNLTVPAGKAVEKLSFSGPGAENVQIIDPINGQYTEIDDIITSGTTLHFRSIAPFRINYIMGDLNNGVITNGTEYYYSSSGASEVISLDFYIKDPSSLSITGNNGVQFEIVNLETGQITFSDFKSTFTSLPNPGFYRINYKEAPLTLTSATDLRVNISYTFPYSEFTYYFYDDAGRLIKKLAPKAVNTIIQDQPFTTSYTYNSLGWILSINDPDQGLTENIYRKDGKLRFFRNSFQSQTGKYSFINYDKQGKVIESGYFNKSEYPYASFVFINHKDFETQPVHVSTVHSILEVTDSGGGLLTDFCYEVNFATYNGPVSDQPIGRVQRNLGGRISKTWSKNKYTDAVPQSSSWFSYDEKGNVEWMDQNLNGLGLKTLDYQYDLQGGLLSVLFQKNNSSERFEHRYSYDASLRLKRVLTRAGNGNFTEQAEYDYYLHGPTKRKELGDNLQGMDYVYTVNGWLKAINHPELNSNNDPGSDGYSGSNSGFEKDIFGMVLEYYSGDFVRGTKFLATNNLTQYDEFFSKNIRSMIWNTTPDPAYSAPAPSQYAYKYDDKYQLLEASFGMHNFSNNEFTVDAGGAYSEYGITYDIQGNTTQLKRNNGSGNLSNSSSFVQAYTSSGKNCMTQTGSTYGPSGDTYSYNSLGLLTSKTKNGSGLYYSYTSYGLVRGVYRDAYETNKVATFSYNERGQRIKKVSYHSNSQVETWYVPDAYGNVVAVYEKDLSIGNVLQTELHIYSTERLAIYNKSTSQYQYEIKDHLGNVRATITETAQGTVSISSWTDYYPFGSASRGFITANSQRYGYQGEYAENEFEETGFNSFELRMYDPELGRWISPDPAGQYYSPYRAMGNNPVNNIDPDGAYAYISYGNGTAYVYSPGGYSYQGMSFQDMAAINEMNNSFISDGTWDLNIEINWNHVSDKAKGYKPICRPGGTRSSDPFIDWNPTYTPGASIPFNIASAAPVSATGGGSGGIIITTIAGMDVQSYLQGYTQFMRSEFSRQYAEYMNSKNVIGRKLVEILASQLNQSIADKYRCYPSVKFRIRDAFKEVEGEVPSILNTEFKQNKSDNKYYPDPNSTTEFDVLFGMNYDKPGSKHHDVYTSVDEKYRGKGAVGALAYAGFADEVDVWGGELKEGAVLQLWGNQDVANKAIGGNPLPPDSYGHTTIFLEYVYSEGEIVGIKVQNQGNTHHTYYKSEGKIIYGANWK